MDEAHNAYQYAQDRRLVEISGLFDPAWYLARHPDLAGFGEGELLDHYMKHGFKERRSPGPLFDGAYYLDQNPDIAEAGTNPLVHFLLHGADEGRWPAPLEAI